MKAYTMGITKDEFVTEMKKHQAADAFIRGTYNHESSDSLHFKGCVVSCSLESVARLKNIKLVRREHKEFETHLGIPTWLAFLEDKIFENCSKARVKTWPVEFAESINEGADLDKIKTPILIFIVEAARPFCKDEKALTAIDGVLVELKKDVLDLPKLDEARSAAASAAAAYPAASAYAAYAAYAASAYAAYTAYAAAAASASAAAASAAAASSVYDASAAAFVETYAGTYAETYDKFADKLLELLKECGEAK